MNLQQVAPRMADAAWSAHEREGAPSETAEIAIRRVTRADAATLMALCDAHRAECGDARAVHGAPRASVLELREALFEPPLRAWAWIAHRNGVAIGYAAATAGFSILERAYYLRLEAAYVDPAWRGRDVEAALWRTAQQAAGEFGCLSLQWQEGAHLPHLHAPPPGTRSLRAGSHLLPVQG